jgi:1,2-diacylglycerol 3-alpha-glucosyltransferase
MKIAYFSDNFYPEISGISDSIITTGEELRKLGHDVMYVAARYSKKDHKPTLRYGADKKLIRDWRADLPVKRLPAPPLPNSPTGQSRFEIPLGFALPAMFTFKPDIIHTQSPHGLGLEALFAARLLGVPLVGTEHTPVEEFAHYGGGELFGKVWLKWEIWYYNRCAFVTTPYQGLYDDMKRRGLDAPGRGQANPVPFASSPSTRDQIAAAKKELGVEGPMLLCSGRLAPEKKVDVILRAVAIAVKEFPTLELLITGHGSAEPALKKLVAELQIEKNVRFLGFVDSSLLPALYRAADAYVLMSTAETQSLSLMQAYASGTPALAARARGLIDYTPDGAGFLIEPGNAQELAEKITILLKDEGLRERMGLAGSAFVAKFASPTIAKDWEDIYQKAISKSR